MTKTLTPDIQAPCGCVVRVTSSTVNPLLWSAEANFCPRHENDRTRAEIAALPGFDGLTD